MFSLLLKIVVIFVFSATPIMAVGEIAEPTLILENGDKKLSFSRSDLLKRSDLKKIEVKEDPSYPGRVMIYQAVPGNQQRFMSFQIQISLPKIVYQTFGYR